MPPILGSQHVGFGGGQIFKSFYLLLFISLIAVIILFHYTTMYYLNSLTQQLKIRNI